MSRFNEFSADDTVFLMCLDTGRWSVHRVPTDIISPLYGHSTAYHPIHNLLYVHGGVYESSELAKDLTSYNPVTRKW